MTKVEAQKTYRTCWPKKPHIKKIVALHNDCSPDEKFEAQDLVLYMNEPYIPRVAVHGAFVSPVVAYSFWKKCKTGNLLIDRIGYAEGHHAAAGLLVEKALDFAGEDVEERGGRVRVKVLVPERMLKLQTWLRDELRLRASGTILLPGRGDDAFVKFLATIGY